VADEGRHELEEGGMKMGRKGALLLATVVVLVGVSFALWEKVLTPSRGDFVEYAMTEKTDIPTAVAIAPDDTVWFTMDFASAIGRIRDGKVERIVTGKRNNVEPLGLAVDHNGTAWYTDALGQAIVSMSADGKPTPFLLETPIARLGRLAIANDGAIWFAEGTAYSITRLKDEKLTRHEIRNVRGGPYGVAADVLGNVWATLQGGNQLLKITPAGEMTEYEVPTRASSPTDLATDAAGNVWFVEFRGNKVGRFGDGKFSEFEVPGESWAGLSGIAVAPDGAVWFGLLRHRSIGRLRDGQIKIWYADISGYVGMLKASAAKR
jgi:virginiamycin B lyase